MLEVRCSSAGVVSGLSFLVCCVLEVRCSSAGVVSGLQAGILDTTPAESHLTSNTQQTKNEMTNVVIQQHSCKLLMMGILMPETCCVYKKENKIASDI